MCKHTYVCLCMYVCHVSVCIYIILLKTYLKLSHFTFEYSNNVVNDQTHTNTHKYTHI